MIVEIEPHVGFGPVRLGMTIAQVRESLGVEFKTYRKGLSEMDTDAFDSVGFYIHYREPGVCKGIELASPAAPTFKGRKLLGQPFNRVLKWFRQLDPSAEPGGAGVVSHELGIALYAPAAKKLPSLPVESVLVFERGHY